MTIILTIRQKIQTNDNINAVSVLSAVQLSEQLMQFFCSNLQSANCCTQPVRSTFSHLLKTLLLKCSK